MLLILTTRCSMTTLCTHCRWHQPSIHTNKFFNYSKCTHDQGLRAPAHIRLSDGLESPADYAYCDSMRNDHGPCGPFALLFEEREVLPHNIQKPF